jgi:hypothetical protein
MKFFPFETPIPSSGKTLGWGTTPFFGSVLRTRTLCFLLLFGFVFLGFLSCAENDYRLEEAEDRAALQEIIAENQKIQDFLLQTEAGLPSLEGILKAVEKAEQSKNPGVAALYGKMKAALQKVSHENKETDFQAYSLFSENLAILVKANSVESVNKFYCPMVKKTWVASGKAVKNPYSPEMRNCGDLILE